MSRISSASSIRSPAASLFPAFISSSACRRRPSASFRRPRSSSVGAPRPSSSLILSLYLFSLDSCSLSFLMSSTTSSSTSLPLPTLLVSLTSFFKLSTVSRRSSLSTSMSSNPSLIAWNSALMACSSSSDRPYFASILNILVSSCCTLCFVWVTKCSIFSFFLGLPMVLSAAVSLPRVPFVWPSRGSAASRSPCFRASSS